MHDAKREPRLNLHNDHACFSLFTRNIYFSRKIMVNYNFPVTFTVPKDILDFDLAVRRHPHCLFLRLVFIFFSTSSLASSLSRSVPFAILFLLSFFLFCLLLAPLSFAVSVSVSRKEEGSAPGNSFAETWHRTAKHE